MQDEDVVGRAHDMTWRFNTEVIGLPIPEKPERLGASRKQWALTALREELTEFESAGDLADEADALIDLTYFALGRLVEMGLAPGALFEEVHVANMAKRRGELSKRPNSLGYDAVKPADWKAPDLRPYLTLTRGDVETLAFMRDLTLHNANLFGNPFEQFDREWLKPEPIEMPKPKVVVLGDARHGKDTVCEMLERLYGLKYTSSSLFCAERVLWPIMTQVDVAGRFIANFDDPSERADLTAEVCAMAAKYNSPLECFEDRGNHRDFWYKAIKDFNRPDASRLARAIFEEHDVYCGIRAPSEFNAVFNAGLPDLVVWVDRSEHVERESRSSCGVEPWMAHHVIDNNGSLEDLERNVRSLFDNFLGLCDDCKGGH